MAVFSGRATAIACAAGVALALSGAPAPAEAQGLFDVLRSLFGGPPPSRPAGPPPPLDGFPDEEIERQPAESRGPYVAYCVRLCDGRYFPLPRNAGSPSMNPQKICSAMCPSAETKVFSGTNISHAVANDGKNYSSIKNAFLYRDKLVNDCSCDGKGATGVASMDALSDPTLRRGDIVVTRDGPKVFTGGQQPPHKADDFVPAESYRGLSKSVRQQMGEMRVSGNVRRVPPAPEQKTAVPPHPIGPHAGADAAPAAVIPVAGAFSTLTR